MTTETLDSIGRQLEQKLLQDEQAFIEADAYQEYKDAARKLADATSAMKAAQLRFSAALQKLTAIVAPIEETK